ncbi:MAG: hypothetical protein QHJ73_12700, partial [Armatimonadota bacterium]|nr:hypothetical protein [Armatimonadota bacterium]
IDSNGDGRLNLRDDPDASTPGQPARYEEAYRELDISLRVPTDFRFSFETPTVDLGKHPHNVMAGVATQLPAVKGFSIKNEGNVNLLNLRLATVYDVNGQSNAPQTVRFVSPDTEYDMTAGRTQLRGVHFPAQVMNGNTTVREHVWWSFAPTPDVWRDPNNAAQFCGGILLKPRPSASPSPTSVRFAIDPVTRQIAGPRIGIITPFGQPVGTYACNLLAYEDGFDAVNNVKTVPDYRLNYRWPAGSEPSAVEPITQNTLKVTIQVTDRQLTEETGGYGIDRCAVDRISGGTLTKGNPPFVLRSDVSPAAVRFSDPAASQERRLALFWSANRETQVGGSLGPLHSWFVYSSRTREPVKDPSKPWAWWLPKDPNQAPNPPETTVPVSSLFGGLIGRTGVAATLAAERYTSPSVVQTLRNGQPVVGGGQAAAAYLFFSGEGVTQDSASTQRIGRLFYTPLGPDMKPVDPGRVYTVGVEQPSLTRLGLRGLSYVDERNDHYLWAFWYGGAQNQWQAYFSRNRGDKTRSSDWSREERLPVYGDFTYVQDPTPALFSWPVYQHLYANTPFTRAFQQDRFLYVFFTGFSKYRRNADIYMARFDANRMQGGRRAGWSSKQTFAPVVKEVLAGREGRTFSSVHLEWATTPLYKEMPQGGKRFVFPRLYRWRRGASFNSAELLTPDPERDAQNTSTWNTGKAPVFNSAEYSYTWKFMYESVDHSPPNPTWPDGQDTDGNGILEYPNTVTIYPLAGVVVFARPMDQGDRILADYVPCALRVASSDQIEQSPSAFLDTRFGAAQSPTSVQTYGSGTTQEQHF